MSENGPYVDRPDEEPQKGLRLLPAIAVIAVLEPGTIYSASRFASSVSRIAASITDDSHYKQGGR